MFFLFLYGAYQLSQYSRSLRDSDYIKTIMMIKKISQNKLQMQMQKKPHT